MNDVSERLKKAREETGFESAQAFAEHIGVNVTTYRSHENGNRPPPNNALKQYAPHLGVTWQYLLAGDAWVPGTQLEQNGAGAAPPARGLRARVRTVTIDELSVEAGAGNGFTLDTLDGERIIDQWSVPLEAIRGYSRAPAEHLKIIMVRGDSMVPDLWPGERVVVDTDDTIPSPEGLFAVWDGVGLLIKRVQLIPGTEPKKLRLISRNREEYDPMEVELSSVRVCGRVVSRWTRT